MTPDGAGWLSHRDLLANMVRAELTARYNTTALGLLWFVLNPLLMMLTLTAVFSYVIRLGIERYPIFVLSALLPWTFFQMGLSNAAGSVTRASGLVKRVHIPRVFIPISAVLASLVHFLVSLGLLLVLMAALGTPLTAFLLLLPAVVLVQTLCLTGLSLMASSLNVFYRDVEHVLAAGLRVLFYLTPAFYPLSYVPARWLNLYLLNPMAGIVETYRRILLEGRLPPPPVMAMAGATTVVALVAGVVVFRRTEPDFDDHL